MILNAHAVLAAFVSLLQLLLGLAALAVGLSAWRQAWSRPYAEGRKSLENRCYLLFLLAFLLVGLSAVSWPLFYLLLQSYVPEFPSAMCIYGVMQVGTGSLGPSRFLPRTLEGLQLTKPLLVFAGGAWLVLYRLNRRTETAPLMGRTLAALVLLGLLAVADAVLETTYLVIPKKVELPPTGCCTTVFDDPHALPSVAALVAEEAARPWLYAAYYGVNVGMIVALFVYARRLRWPGPAPGLAPVLGGAVISLAVSALFLVEVISPALLHLPYHHCPYDLVSQAPEAIVAVALFLIATFAVGWACVMCWFGNCPETTPFLHRELRVILLLGSWSHLASLAMISTELALA